MAKKKTFIRVSDYLGTGKDQAKTGKELCKLFGVSIRDLTQEIERERKNGVPICASTDGAPGYYLAADRAEMTAYTSSLYRRASNIFGTRRACLKTLEKLPERGGDDGET